MTRGFLTALTGMLLIVLVASAVPARPFFRGGASSGGCSPGMTCGPNGCYVVSGVSTVSAPYSPVPQAPVASLPAIPSSASVGEVLHGVDRSKGVGLIDAVQIGPPDASKPQLDVGKVTLPEDGAKPYVVIVGDKDYQRRAKAEIVESGIDKFLHVVSYAEDQFQGSGVGYSKGVWIVGGRDDNDRGEVFSYDEDLQAIKGPLKKFVERLRKPDGVLDKGVLPSLARMVDPGVWAWNAFKLCIGPLCNVAMVALLIVAVVRK